MKGILIDLGVVLLQLPIKALEKHIYTFFV